MAREKNPLNFHPSLIDKCWEWSFFSFCERYRCGPTSVAAVKRGEVRKQFDTGFQFAEVNADKVYWKYKGSNQPLKLMDKRTNEYAWQTKTWFNQVQ